LIGRQGSDDFREPIVDVMYQWRAAALGGFFRDAAEGSGSIFRLRE